jgi:hypothetical protein
LSVGNDRLHAGDSLGLANAQSTGRREAARTTSELEQGVPQRVE